MRLGQKHTQETKEKIGKKSQAYRAAERQRKLEIDEKLARLAALEEQLKTAGAKN